MNKLIILCVESNKKSRTDYIYIDAAIKAFLKQNRKIIYKPIFLDNKYKYNDKKKVKEINDLKKSFCGNTKVVYCIDVDDYDTKPEDKACLEQIKKYCDDNAFDFVFFSKDVEDVFWGKQVPDNEKVKKAAEFVRKMLIYSVVEKKLRYETYIQHCSNLLNILEKNWNND